MPAEHSTPPPLHDLVSLTVAAEVCGLSSNHIRLLVRTGRVWGIKVGRNWLTTQAAVERYVATTRRPGPKSHSQPG